MALTRPTAGVVARVIPVLTTGVLIGVLMVVFSTSMAALVFRGELHAHLSTAIALVLLGNAVVMIVVGAWSSLPGTVAGVHPTTVPIAAAIAAAVATDLPGGREHTFLTVVLAVSLATTITGAFFLLLGSLELGDLVRFVPYPVVGGFLAGAGWLLLVGAVDVWSGVKLSVSGLPDLAQAEVAAKSISGLAFGAVLYAAVRRYRHYLTLPATVLGGTLAFYAFVLVSGQSVGDAESAGWLIGPFPGQSGWEPSAARAVASADWSEVLGNALPMATLVAVAVLSLLLNVSGIELSTNRDADLNRELRVTGFANMAAGIGGGLPGFHGVNLTVLAHRTGVSSPVVGVVAGVVSALVLVTDVSVLGVLPRPVLGGLVFFLGLGLFVEWVYDSRRRLPVGEYAIVLAILLITAALGFLQGVLAGLLIAVVLFVVDYSRTDVVKHALSGATYHSRVERSPAERKRLHDLGESLEILRLQGYIFFGTANALLERVRARAARDGPNLSFLLMDFRRVTGLDSSALSSFSRIHRVGQAEGFPLVLTGLATSLRARFASVGLERQDETLQLQADLDGGVQWCEDRWLETHAAATAGEPSAELAQLLSGRLDPAALMPYLDPLELPAGTRVIQEGDIPDDVFFVESGRLTASLDLDGAPPVQLRAMGPGTVVGEVALYHETTRTASVTTDTPCTVYRLSRRALLQMERLDPRLASAVHALFAHRLAERLADMTEAMKVLRD